MSERKESSVLFSLRELRSIEDERVTEEESAKRAAEEARIRAATEAERAAFEAEEAKRRAAADAERAERERVEGVHREGQLRVEEAERRARVEAQARIEEQRLAQEMHVRTIEAQKKRPVGLIVTAVVLTALAIGLGIFLYQRSADLDKERRAKQQLEEKITETQVRIDGLIDQQDAITKRLIAAKTEEEKLRAEKELADKQAELAAERERLEQLKGGAKGGGKGGGGGGKGSGDTAGSGKGSGSAIKRPDCDPDEPLGCLPQ